MDKINLFQLQKNVHAMMGKVHYSLGAKAKLSTPVNQIKFIDCSGFVRWLVYHSTEHHVEMVDGSFNQRDWLLKQSAIAGNVIQRINHYSDIANDPSKLYLCTMNPEGGEAGHIWFVNDGFTMESHGHTTGPDERLWNTPVLKNNVDFIFRWEHVWIP